MNFFEFLPLIIILLLQFVYQFQKAAKRRLKEKERLRNEQFSNSSAEGSTKDSSAEPGRGDGGASPATREGLHFAEEKVAPSSLTSPTGNPEQQDRDMRREYMASLYQDFFQSSSSQPYDKPYDIREVGFEETKETAIREEEPLPEKAFAENLTNDEDDEDALEEEPRDDTYSPYGKTAKRRNFKKSIVEVLRKNPRKAIVLNEILNKAKF